MNKLPFNASSPSAFKRLQNLGSEGDLLEIMLNYVHAKIDGQILTLRSTLSKISDVSVRAEYLGRIDELQVVKSGLTLAAVALDVESLEKEEDVFNVS
jgi:hypothetical protein